jgi:hypothetical protein
LSIWGHKDQTKICGGYAGDLQGTHSDLHAIVLITAWVHPAFPEDESVFEERLTLYPAGVHVLEENSEIRGYIISHLWRSGSVRP